jgi:membrane protein
MPPCSSDHPSHSVPTGPASQPAGLSAPRRGTLGDVPIDLRGTLRDVGRSFPGRDLSLWAAGATFFGIIGSVPLAMLSLRLAAALVGPEVILAEVEALLAGIGSGHGTPGAVRTLTGTALALSWPQTAALLLPAGLYGEGLRRAFLQMSPQEADVFTGWRGRLGVLPVAVVTPFLVAALLGSAPTVAPLYTAGGGQLLLGVVIGFHVLWVLVSVTTLLAFALVAPDRVGLRALLVGAFGTGAVLAGFLLGFVLFLAIPLDWSLPFGGLPVVGALAALGLWLYLLHVLLLLGYRLTLVIDTSATRANGTATAPMTSPPTTAEPGSPKKTACATTDDA